MRELERVLPVLALDLRLDHAVQRVGLVAGHVVDLAQARERGEGLVGVADLEAQLGHVERRHRLLGLGLGDQPRLCERLLVLAERAVHVHEADRRGRGAAHVLRRLAEIADGLLLAAGRGGGVAEMAERDLIGGVELDGTAEGIARLLRAPLGRKRLAEVVPRVGVLGGELGRALELLGGVLGVELHARATGEHQQLDVLGRAGKARERRLAALAILAGT